MPLYRATYEREKRLRRMTFFARCEPLALDFAYSVLQHYIASLGGSWIFSVEPAHPPKGGRVWVHRS